MATRDVTICNDLGLHARAAARLVECANNYSSTIQVTYGEKSVNAKSIMGVLMLAAAKGSVIVVETQGRDEDDALEGVCGLIEEGFGEL